MPPPTRSYIICCTPRSGSHLLADGLGLTGIAGNPVERFPRPSEHIRTTTAVERRALIAEPPPEESYDAMLDANYIAKILEHGTTDNGVFGVNIHRFQFADAIRRIRSYLRDADSEPHEILSKALPNLSYVWLRRNDKVAQAVSWHKAVQSGRYIKMRGLNDDRAQRHASVEFEFVPIKTYWSAIRNSENAWQHYFQESKIRPYVVHYEDLCANYEKNIRAVIKFLGLDDQTFEIVSPRHEKAGDAQSLEWAKKFVEIQSKSKPLRT